MNDKPLVAPNKPPRQSIRLPCDVTLSIKLLECHDGSETPKELLGVASVVINQESGGTNGRPVITSVVVSLPELGEVITIVPKRP